MRNDFVSTVLRQLVCSLVLLCCAFTTHAQFDPRSDGSDGAFSPTANTVIDLGLAKTGAWDSAPLAAGQGVYDPDQWIVVFKYSSVNIPSGVTVSFKNHPSNPPVVWLVQGTVTIGGRLSLDGTYWSVAPPYSPGGPGGFRGGRRVGYNTPGFGIGADLTYGVSEVSYPNSGALNAGCFPLLGGAGSSDGYDSRLGGGGGAILIAAGNSIALATGARITANGAYYNARGGMIRLAAPSITGMGASLEAFTEHCTACSGAHGRIRVEADQVNIAPSIPMYSSGPLGAQIRFLRDDLTPAVRVLSVGGVPAPTDPKARFELPGEIVVATRQVQIVVECRNVPSNAAVKVYLRSASLGGTHSFVNATFQSGTTAQSTWIATGDLGAPAGYSTVQAHVVLP